MAAIFHAQLFLDPQRHLGRNADAAVEHARQRHARDAQLCGSFGDRQSERGQHIFAQGFAGVRGIVHSVHGYMFMRRIALC